MVVDWQDWAEDGVAPTMMNPCLPMPLFVPGTQTDELRVCALVVRSTDLQHSSSVLGTNAIASLPCTCLPLPSCHWPELVRGSCLPLPAQPSSCRSCQAIIGGTVSGTLPVPASAPSFHAILIAQSPISPPNPQQLLHQSLNPLHLFDITAKPCQLETRPSLGIWDFTIRVDRLPVYPCLVWQPIHRSEDEEWLSTRAMDIGQQGHRAPLDMSRFGGPPLRLPLHPCQAPLSPFQKRLPPFFCPTCGLVRSVIAHGYLHLSLLMDVCCGEGRPLPLFV